MSHFSCFSATGVRIVPGQQKASTGLDSLQVQRYTINNATQRVGYVRLGYMHVYMEGRCERTVL